MGKREGGCLLYGLVSWWASVSWTGEASSVVSMCSAGDGGGKDEIEKVVVEWWISLWTNQA